MGGVGGAYPSFVSTVCSLEGAPMKDAGVIYLFVFHMCVRVDTLSMSGRRSHPRSSHRTTTFPENFSIAVSEYIKKHSIKWKKKVVRMNSIHAKRRLKGTGYLLH